jgi:hypothetical protein
MLIDGTAIQLSDAIEVNQLFSDAVNWSKSVTRDELINNWMIGRDCVDLLISGDLWLVCDTDHMEYDAQLDCHIKCATYRDGRKTWICNRELFQLVQQLSPCDSCEQVEDRILRQRWPMRGSKAGLELFLSSLPCCARKDYVMERIDGEEYGLRKV